LHFITFTLIVYECTHVRAYTDDVAQYIFFVSERKASKDPLDTARCLEKSNLHRHKNENILVTYWKNELKEE